MIGVACSIKSCEEFGLTKILCFSAPMDYDYFGLCRKFYLLPCDKNVLRMNKESF